MIITGIDDEKCIKCLECVKECPSGLFYKPPTQIGEKRVVKFKGQEGCIECGHCIAVCPTDAILYEEAEKPLKFENIKDPASLINYDILLKAFQARRSIRRYKKQTVSKSDIETILKAMRYSPTAQNSRSWKYIVIQDEEKRDPIRNKVIKMLGLLKKLVDHKRILKYFMPKGIKELITDPKEEIVLEDFFERIENGEDPVFYNAPVLLITYNSKYNGFADIDAGIAFTHGMFAAQSLGLGTCCIGFAQEAINRYKNLKKTLNIPKDMRINGVMIIGHSEVKFYNIPPRDPLDVTWV